jgi:hypothetical protein
MAETLEQTFLEFFLPDAEARPVPEKVLAFVAAPIEIDKQMTAEWIMSHNVIDEHRELVKSTTHVTWRGVDEDAYEGRKFRHRFAWCKTEKTSLNVIVSGVERIRNIWPKERTSSMET